VQTSLRALMQQEEERVRAEDERLAQLRAAKIRLDRERAEAAREADELRARKARDEEAERDAKRAAAVEAARVEALARARLAPRIETIVVEKRAPSRFGAGLAVGLAVASALGAVGWLTVGAPRIRAAADASVAARAALDRECTRARAAGAAADDALADSQREVAALRAEVERLRRPPPAAPVAKPPAQPPRRVVRNTPACDPHDPLCGDLDAR